MLVALSLLVSTFGAAEPQVKVPVDRFVRGCGGVELRASRRTIEAACRVVDGVVEVVTDHGDIDGLRFRAERWPVAIRVVLKAWRFENVSVSVTDRDGQASRVDATDGKCAHAIVSCLGRDEVKTGERRIDERTVVPTTEVTVKVEVDARALAPGESLTVGWIDAYRR